MSSPLDVTSTLSQLRELRPHAPWLSPAEDLGRLALWVAGHHSGDVGCGADGSGGEREALTLGSAVQLAWSHAQSFGGAAALGEAISWPSALQQTMQTAFQTGHATAQLLNLAISALSRVLSLLHLTLSLGITTIVFVTMTFYMLSSKARELHVT